MVTDVAGVVVLDVVLDVPLDPTELVDGPVVVDPFACEPVVCGALEQAASPRAIAPSIVASLLARGPWLRGSAGWRVVEAGSVIRQRYETTR
jgi:hypothetical protein